MELIKIVIGILTKKLVMKSQLLLIVVIYMRILQVDVEINLIIYVL